MEGEGGNRKGRRDREGGEGWNVSGDVDCIIIIFTFHFHIIKRVWNMLLSNL